MKTFTLALYFLAFSLQSSPLTSLRSTVLSLREHPDDNRETRGATAEWTAAKHQVRDWVESHLAMFAENGNEILLAEVLRDELDNADLLCADFNTCLPSSVGFLDEVRVNREKEFLIVTTAVGIWCGYDYSAYVYKWSGNRWQRIWENEQNTYSETAYFPQIVHTVHISTPDAAGNRLLITLGSLPGCSSAFLPVYYRVWRMNARDEIAKEPLLEGSELASIDGDPPIEARVTPDDILVGFKVGGTGYGESHKALRHFEVRDGQARQMDPIAPTPRDFVEEWLAAPWLQSAPRSESAALKQWHDKLHRTDGMGDFPDPAMKCTASPDLWQIATRLNDSPKTYYLVRWRQPYNFMMAGVSDRPYPDCTLPDPKADEQPALFR